MFSPPSPKMLKVLSKNDGIIFLIIDSESHVQMTLWPERRAHVTYDINVPVLDLILPLTFNLLSKFIQKVDLMILYPCFNMVDINVFNGLDADIRYEPICGLNRSQNV